MVVTKAMAPRRARLPSKPDLPLLEPWHAWDDSDQSDDGDAPWDEEAGGVFVNMVLDLQYKGKLSAKDVCLLCFWAHRSGAPAKVGEIGFRPNAQSGQYQKHLDAVLETKMHSDWYTVDVPVHNKHDQSRVIRKSPVLLPFDELAEEVANTHGFQQVLSTKVANGELSDLYHNHPNHTADTDVPIGLFVDGVPTVKKDSCIGFFVFNVVTNARFLCAILRKRSLCHCGCRGWCSYYAIWSYLAWAFNAMAEGVYSLTQHDGTEWQPGTLNAERAGTNMPFKGLLVQLKGDWGEWASSFGFAGHSTSLYPCICCYAAADDWFQTDDVTFEKLPWLETTMEDYLSACALCEVWVTFANRREHARVRARLAFDRRKEGGRGRCLTDDMPTFNLLKGDRLEPCRSCPDIGVGFDELAQKAFPVTVLFWRRSAETILRHRNPLFEVPGVTMLTLMVDTLHCMFLGVVPKFLQACIWMCIMNNVWGSDAVHQQTRDELNIQACRAALFDWYKKMRQSNQGHALTELGDLTPGMLGTRASQCFTPKGAESKCMIPFVVGLLEKYRAVLPAPQVNYLLLSGRALMRLLDKMQAVPSRPTPAACKDGMFEILDWFDSV